MSLFFKNVSFFKNVFFFQKCLFFHCFSLLSIRDSWFAIRKCIFKKCLFFSKNVFFFQNISFFQKCLFLKKMPFFYCFASLSTCDSWFTFPPFILTFHPWFVIRKSLFKNVSLSSFASRKTKRDIFVEDISI